MAAQIDPEKLKRLNWRIPWPEWLVGAPAKPSEESSENGSTGSTAATAVESMASSMARSFGRSPAGSPEGCSVSFPPLTIIRNGDAAWVERPGEKLAWNNDDFAFAFMYWVASEYPDCVGATISLPDIERDLFPRFKAAYGCPKLKLGALQRGQSGLREVRYYTDQIGERRALTCYWVPDVPAMIAAAEGRRA